MGALDEERWRVAIDGPSRSLTVQLDLRDDEAASYARTNSLSVSVLGALRTTTAEELSLRRVVSAIHANDPGDAARRLPARPLSVPAEPTAATPIAPAATQRQSWSGLSAAPGEPRAWTSEKVTVLAVWPCDMNCVFCQQAQDGATTAVLSLDLGGGADEYEPTIVQ